MRPGTHGIVNVRPNDETLLSPLQAVAHCNDVAGLGVGDCMSNVDLQQDENRWLTTMISSTGVVVSDMIDDVVERY